VAFSSNRDTLARNNLFLLATDGSGEEERLHSRCPTIDAELALPSLRQRRPSR